MIVARQHLAASCSCRQKRAKTVEDSTIGGEGHGEGCSADPMAQKSLQTENAELALRFRDGAEPGPWPDCREMCVGYRTTPPCLTLAPHWQPRQNPYCAALDSMSHERPFMMELACCPDSHGPILRSAWHVKRHTQVHWELSQRCKAWKLPVIEDFAQRHDPKNVWFAIGLRTRGQKLHARELGLWYKRSPKSPVTQ